MPDRISALTEAQCDEITAKVAELERFWVRRHPELPSFTLGGAAYLDVPEGGVPRYLVAKSRGNKILARHFGWLHELLAELMTELLDGPVFITPRFALPGFHIYGHHPSLAELSPRVHWDLQDTRLPAWENEPRPAGERCSFTLPISIPEGGAGVDIWDISSADVSYAEAVAQAQEEAPRYFAYTQGELFVHTGDLLHKIASVCLPKPGELRLTLQGHGRKSDRGWELYW